MCVGVCKAFCNNEGKRPKGVLAQGIEHWVLGLGIGGVAYSNADADADANAELPFFSFLSFFFCSLLNVRPQCYE